MAYGIFSDKTNWFAEQINEGVSSDDNNLHISGSESEEVTDTEIVMLRSKEIDISP